MIFRERCTCVRATLLIVHLGYDSAAHPVQILPRKVTSVQDVIQIALTVSLFLILYRCTQYLAKRIPQWPVYWSIMKLFAFVMIAVSESSMTFLRVPFSFILTVFSRFPSTDPADSPHYIPPNLNKPPIVKVTCCEGTIAALTARGDVWTFSVPGCAANPGTEGDRDREKDRPVVKPQRVWAARKSIDPAKVSSEDLFVFYLLT